MRADVAFVCAMPIEAAPIVRKLKLKPVAVDGLDLRAGSLDGRPVVVTVTGMGTANASSGVEALLDRVGAGHVMVVGVTGAVDTATPIGALIVPDVVIDARDGSEHRPSAPPRRAGALWTSDDLVTEPGQIAELHGRGVVALDMETGAIAAVCERRGVPWSVYRAVSDRAGDGALDDDVLRLIDAQGRLDRAAAARYVLSHPGRLPDLLAFGRGAKRARDVAAAAALDAARTA